MLIPKLATSPLVKARLLRKLCLRETGEYGRWVRLNSSEHSIIPGGGGALAPTVAALAVFSVDPTS